MPSITQALSQIGKATLFATEFAQDLYLYAKYCGISPFQSGKKKLYYKMIIETHAIEKGLSLANPRMLFGRQKITTVMRYVRRYGINSNDMPVQMAIGALQTYLAAHRAAGITDPMLDDIETFLIDRRTGSGGLRHFPAGLLQQDISGGLLLARRFSCRMFAQKPVDRETLERIVALAQTAPSQCNRQATKVTFYSDRKLIAELLSLQAGASGFSENVTSLLVVSYDLAAWGGAQQRNQGYVDASLFAMNFMLAAYAVGVATCPLNLAVRHGVERRIKRAGSIPDDQRLVMMIALGWPASDGLKAAASPRRPVSEILTVVEGV
ncbi:nitroreductase family protein [Bradyrhizobium ottawaense]|uniref:nitroreductase family protein n=1 Tax=Bradyrhizobium ottawaense TaxID=931866 RepID=UPI001BAD23CF|nr:nitroreductase family protein [Bradyrhizobium ottawaense]